MPFTKIKGQESAVRFLKTSLQQKKLSHAYLFFGPQGIGKKTIALDFAKSVNCTRLHRGEACAACSSCKRIDALNHPDVAVVSPSDDVNPVIKIDQIRSVIHRISMRPFEAARKVSIIDGAEYMTQQAANALLKILEEPPATALLIIIAESANRLFPTIVSRCQGVRFFPLSPLDAKNVLMEEYRVTGDEAHCLAYLSQGRIGEALRLQEAQILKKRDRVIRSFAGGNTASESVDPDSVDTKQINLMLDLYLGWVRDLAVEKCGMNERSLFNIDRHADIVRQARTVDSDRLDEFARIIIEAKQFLKEKANSKLVLSTVVSAVTCPC